MSKTKLGFLTVLLVVLTSCGSGGGGDGAESAAEPEQKPALTGSITIDSGEFWNGIDWPGNYTGENPKVGDECTGSDGYDDLSEGADVTVKDQDGSIIASGQLSSGEFSDTGPGSYASCELSFEIPDLPDADFYEVEVSQRGPQTYSKAELEEIDYHLELSIGGD